MPGRSVITNLLQCVQDWTYAIDRGDPVYVIYLDFSKAFDRVPKNRLLYKLNHVGIRVSLLAWLSPTSRTEFSVSELVTNFLILLRSQVVFSVGTTSQMTPSYSVTQ